MDILQSITRLPDSKPLVKIKPISKKISTNIPLENLNFYSDASNIKSPADPVNIASAKFKVNREGLITGLVFASVIAITIIITINHIRKTKNEKHENT